MVNYATLAPGVYVEDVTPAGPIAGAGTSVAAFIGQVKEVTDVAKGKPVYSVTNWGAYTKAYGAWQKAGTGSPAATTTLQLPYAVRGFFENGGTNAIIVPLSAAPDDSGVSAALNHLTRLGDVSLVCLPGVDDAGLQRKVIDHCEVMKDRFAVLDGTSDLSLQPDGKLLKTQLPGLMTKLGFGALYWPWLVQTDPDPAAKPGSLVTVPPSGHVAGVMARSDAAVGVHKAPANEVVRGVIDLSYVLNDTEQGTLNQAGVNAIRVFAGRPPTVWGARTLATDTNWRYVNVRRLICYIEDSLLQGLRWAVFEPNNLALWKGLERSITEFLTRVWRAGALFGASAKEAFYVKIDEELNPEEVRKLGEVYVEIGLAPTRPAEYVVLRLGLWDGGAKISET
jgi:phage tail sheath protein FI